MQNGIITKGIGGFYYVLSEGSVYECKARGVFRKQKITPTVGDSVTIEVKNGKGSIVEILPRHNVLVRPAVANVDMLIIVVAAASPDPNLMLIDKMLVHAEKSGIEPVICINKTDIQSPDSIVNIYEKAGYSVICTCAEKHENIQQVKDLIRGKITAFAGLSGVGKSTLLSIITDKGLETGELSQKIERGKHTTRHVELIPIENGFVFDTPGFSSLEIPQMEESELFEYFPEIARHASGCKFRGCSHTKDAGCSVKAAVLVGEIPESRYESYLKMYETLKQIKNYHKN